MTLTALYNYMNTEVVNHIPAGWQIAASDTVIASDELVEVVFLGVDFEYVEMTQLVASGNLAFVFYKQFDDALDTQYDAVEQVVEWLHTLDLADVLLGDPSPLLARVEEPGVASDGRIPFRTVTVSVPFELIPN